MLRRRRTFAPAAQLSPRSTISLTCCREPRCSARPTSQRPRRYSPRPHSSSDTKIVAPFDGVVSERQVQPGDYVNVGTNLISVVPLPNVYVIANYKETQLTHVKPGQPVKIKVDSFPKEILHGSVERISPASGSQFALLPPDNATGNFTKVVQRIAVRIALDKGPPVLEHLLPGMSVVTSIDTGDGSK
jgi:membrane fusion protein, multidrug efflux system